MNTSDSASPSWTRSVLSHDQVVQWTKAKVRGFSDFVLCLGRMTDSNDAITTWEGQVEEFKMSYLLQRIAGNRWRSNLIRVEYFRSVFVIADSSREPE